MWFVYILKCRDGSYYTGITNDPQRRLDAHNSGRGAKYTRSRLPVRLLHCERFPTKGTALAREARIKRLGKEGKRLLIASGRL